MKNMFQKMKEKTHNAGSGLVLVIVALGFIGVLVGALLTAVGYVYRMKLYDYNARDNFNYIEQAMDEVYAGIGSRVTTYMQYAYEDTLEAAIVYDPVLKSYKNIGDEAANEYFKNRFMQYLVDANLSGDPSDFLTEASLRDAIPDMISNDSVKAELDDLKVRRYNSEGDIYATGDVMDKIVIYNVRLTRNAEYNRSTAKGDFKQTLSTDIVISRPDFDVKFNGSVYDVTSLFSYVMIADSGVEFNPEKEVSTSITVNGNIYAASDYYNKTYNNYDNNDSSYTNEMTYTDAAGTLHKFRMNKVSNYTYTDDDTSTLINHNAKERDLAEAKSYGNDYYAYNGNNDRSRYSGIYVDNRTVNLIADKIICPGTIAVMNRGNLRVYGRNGALVSDANVWTDNVVIGGDSFRTVTGSGDDQVTTRLGGQASFNANLFVRDDTSIEADGASFALAGSYFGYSNSSTSDDRTFVPSVSKTEDFNIYQEEYTYTDENGVTRTATRNRSHYNSSAIIVNGQYASLDFSQTLNLFIAGRSYIELSRQTASKTENTEELKDGEGYIDSVVETYQYDPKIKDYKTGESISIRSSQLAYIPFKAPAAGTNGEYFSELPDSVKNETLFEKYFGEGAVQVPVIYVTETVDGKEKTFTYFDFDYAADKGLYDHEFFTAATVTGDDLSAAFIKDYFDYLNYKEAYDDETFSVTLHPDVDTDILGGDDFRSILTDVTDYQSFRAGQIRLNNLATSKKYGSGALTQSNVWKDTLTSTTDKEISFEVITKKDAISSMVLGDSEGTFSGTTSAEASVVNFAKEYQQHYNYLKWTLNDLPSNGTTPEALSDVTNDAGFVDYVLSKKGLNDESLTPINYYMNFDKINDGTNINPSNFDLGSYKVWVSDGDVTIEDGANKDITGMVICKGDVYFGSSVETFNGIIISGGKVFVQNSVTNINASELTINIINQCMVKLKDEDENTVNKAKKVLSVFKNYEDLAVSDIVSGSNDEAKMITNIDYSDVIRYDNWMKNVE